MGFSLTWLDWTVGSFAVLGSIAFGWYMSRRVGAGKDSSHFFLAGRNLPWWIVGLSLYATNIGAEHLVGLTGDAYRYGLCAGTVELTTAMCLGIAASVLFPYYIRNQVFTIPEFLEMRYNPVARSFFSGLMLMICIMTKMAFCLYAGALVIASLCGWDVTSTAGATAASSTDTTTVVMGTVAALAAVTAVFTMVGGFAGVAYADIIQSTVKILGCALMLGIGLYKVGGWHALLEKVPNAMHIYKPADPDYPFWGIILVGLYGGTFYWGIDQVNVQRVLGAANLKQARWGAMFCVLLKLTPVFIFAMPGVIAKALYPNLANSKTTFVTLMNELLPTGVRGLVLAALVCALISSLDATMNSVSTLFVRDFVLRFRPRTSERMQVFIGRWAIAVCTLAAVAAAYLVYKTPGGLYKYLQTISVYLVMPITPAIVFGILSKRVNMIGAVASVAVGSVLAALFVTDEIMGLPGSAVAFPFLHCHSLLVNYSYLLVNYSYRGLWGTILVTLTLFAVSYLTTAPKPEQVATTTVDWGRKWEAFGGITDWRLHLVVLVAVTIVLYWWLR
jgi:SSS family solute:Na+ symporter